MTRIPITDPLHAETRPRQHGERVVLVVNPAAGSGTGQRIINDVRLQLPEAEIVTLRPNQDLDELLRAVAQRADVLAIGGGDGTIACAATVAVDTGRPLAVFPAGTFNHFAKDIGCATPADTIRAIRAGTVSCVDLVSFNDSRIIINTASIGAYPRFVRTRERLEHKIGKPLAAAYAMLHTLRHEEPVHIQYDDKSLHTALFFLGNSTYSPPGFAPAKRKRLDDGLIDVRILETGPLLSKLRVMMAILFGRLAGSPLYHEHHVPEFSFTSLDGPTAVARDGEVDGLHERATFSVRHRALTVFHSPVAVAKDKPCTATRFASTLRDSRMTSRFGCDHNGRTARKAARTARLRRPRFSR